MDYEAEMFLVNVGAQTNIYFFLFGFSFFCFFLVSALRYASALTPSPSFSVWLRFH